MHFFQRDPVAGNHTNVYIIGVHAPHGDLQIDTFSDIACLLRERPWGSKVLVAGDWNVDQLPSLSNDPWSDQPGREMHHVAERLLLQTLADRFRLCFNIPDIVCSAPGAPFDNVCWFPPSPAYQLEKQHNIVCRVCWIMVLARLGLLLKLKRIGREFQLIMLL